MNIIRRVISFLICLFSLHCLAQTISVSSFKLLDTDLTANTAGTMEQDQNGEIAALIKVVTTQTGFTFDGGSLGIVKTIQKPSEIWVYVPRGLKKITIAHPQFGLLRDYYLNIPIEAARTYELVLSTRNQKEESTEYVDNSRKEEHNEFDKNHVVEIGKKELDYTGKKTHDGADYYGDLKSEKPDGYGRAIYKNGNMYEGYFINGKRQGYGIYKFFDGERYEGEWYQDQQYGNGTYYFANNNRYEGSWLHDYQQGHGVMYYFNGDKYDGDWEIDKRSGKGVYTYSTGAYYKGDWQNDKRNGNGFFDWGDGSTYDGEWKDNMRSGFGTFKFSNGDIYVGQWEKDSYNGNGKLTKSNGEILEGKFKAGKLVKSINH